MMPTVKKTPASFLANPTATKKALRRGGLSLKHALGQNFLISDTTIQHILALAQLNSQDTVLEIGPGIGTLTVALLPYVQHLIAIERDASFIPVLEQNVQKALAANRGQSWDCSVGDSADEASFGGPATGADLTACQSPCSLAQAATSMEHLGKFTLLMGDALTADYTQLAQLLKDRNTPITKLVANLPYQIAASVVLELFQSVSMLSAATVMVQKEVADRMRAAPGNKIYGAYTAKLSLWASVVDEFFVSRNNFLPAPHVDSAVVHLVATPASALAQTLTFEEQQRTAKFMDAAFSQRRKKMINALSASGFDKGKVLQAMMHLDVDPAIRAEKLTTDDFIRLCAQVEGWNTILGSF